MSKHSARTFFQKLHGLSTRWQCPARIDAVWTRVGRKWPAFCTWGQVSKEFCTNEHLFTKKTLTKECTEIGEMSPSSLLQWKMNFAIGFLGMYLHGDWWVQTSDASLHSPTCVDAYCFKVQGLFQKSSNKGRQGRGGIPGDTHTRVLIVFPANNL